MQVLLERQGVAPVLANGGGRILVSLDTTLLLDEVILASAFSFVVSELSVCGRGAARAEDAQGTPTLSHISPSILVYEDKSFLTPVLANGGGGGSPPVRLALLLDELTPVRRSKTQGLGFGCGCGGSGRREQRGGAHPGLARQHHFA